MTNTRVRAVDTSVAVPLLVASHEAHEIVVAWSRDKALRLCGHALAETYAVLTRLPSDARVLPADAVALLDDAFEGHLTLPTADAGQIHRELARLGVFGGASYDGLVALAARAHNVVLATRDGRARSTYEVVGARVEVIVSGGRP